MHRVSLNRHAFIIPSVGVLFVQPFQIYDSPAGKPAMAMGLPLAIRFSDGPILALGPSLLLDKDYGTVGISIGVVFPTRRSGTAGPEGWDVY